MTDREGLAARIAELEHEVARSRLLMSIGVELSSQMELADLLPLVISKVSELMEADRSTLYLFDESRKELWTMVGEELEISEIRMPATQGIAGHVAQSGTMLNVPDAYALDFFDRSWDQKTGYRTRSVLCMPLRKRHGGLLGVLQVLNKCSGTAFTTEDEAFLTSLSAQVAPHVENAALHRQIEAVFEAIVNAISIALDGRDPVTAGHSRRVTQYSLAIAKAVHRAKEGPFAKTRFTRAQLRELQYAGLLHDFGKVGVPEAVLQKAERLPVNWIHVIEQRLGKQRAEVLLERFHQMDVPSESLDAQAAEYQQKVDFLVQLNRAGFLSAEAAETLKTILAEGLIDEMEFDYLSIQRGTLTPSERQVMESHVSKTEAVLAAIPWPAHMSDIPAIASAHHECPNGKGYPKGLARAAIPLRGLIMAVADVYDALTAQDRPYKPAIPHEKSANIIRNMAEEGRLDSDIVELFLEQDLHRSGQEEQSIDISRDTGYIERVQSAISHDGAGRDPTRSRG